MTDGPRPARERILDAAEASLRAHGIRMTTMTGVARAAGVGRSGLYWHYPDKAALVSAALIRRDAEFWTRADDRVRGRRGLAAKVAEAVAIARTSPWGPLATELRDREPDQFAQVVGAYVHDVIPGTVGFWHAHLADAVRAGEVRADLELRSAAEFVLRQVISLAAIPGDAVDIDDPASVRRYLETYLIPALS
ncbi:TetR family transcriptional regulator [Actinocorallia herbida]|uniref:TetR family transcriptional regulator n=1 Tax=Actinocorallia herbida TaxID=58109 RepID=A0A3N1D035_9ACTN|nr:TetR/AcrR family transcriptional regulator [Actinocorallia herbida]ROO86889.1 TetR family transcriptional regulator [Actinocorallia herbida]